MASMILLSDCAAEALRVWRVTLAINKSKNSTDNLRVIEIPIRSASKRLRNWVSLQFSLRSLTFYMFMWSGVRGIIKAVQRRAKQNKKKESNSKSTWKYIVLNWKCCAGAFINLARNLQSSTDRSGTSFKIFFNMTPGSVAWTRVN